MFRTTSRLFNVLQRLHFSVTAATGGLRKGVHERRPQTWSVVVRKRLWRTGLLLSCSVAIFRELQTCLDSLDLVSGVHSVTNETPSSFPDFWLSFVLFCDSADAEAKHNLRTVKLASG